MRASLLLLPCLIACAPHKHVFVGPLNGTDARIAVLVEGFDVTAYVCGGAETRTTLTRWFEGSTLGSDSGTLQADDWFLSWYGHGHTGTLTDPDGAMTNWEVEDQSHHAALYSADDSGCDDGAIVWNEGGERMLQGTWGCNDVAKPMLEVTPVGKLKLSDEIEATVATPDGDRTFTLTKVTGQ